MADTIPYELKRIIYDYVDLETIKFLRQVSKAWASVGAEVLLLPSFHIKSHSLDIRRLIDIGSSPVISQHAAKVTRKIVFQNSEWNPRYFRKIVCNRHEHRQHYETTDFVPTQVEQEALDELDLIIAQKDQDDKEERQESKLVGALRVIPQANCVEIECQNPFRNLILRKVWEEYALEAYRTVQSRLTHSVRVLSAALQAGLPIQHFSQDQVLSSCFDRDDLVSNATLWRKLGGLKSLKLVISDLDGVFAANDTTVERLRRFLSSFRTLEHLSVHLQTLDAGPVSFLPVTETGTLCSLSLSSVSINPIEFNAFLENHSSTLKRLHLHSVDLPQGQGSWHDFLEDLTDVFGDKLEKFRLDGMVRSIDGDNEQWHLWPRYDDEWNILEKERSPRTRELEDYVLRGGPWPMVPSDSFSF